MGDSDLDLDLDFGLRIQYKRMTKGALAQEKQQIKCDAKKLITWMI